MTNHAPFLSLITGLLAMTGVTFMVGGAVAAGHLFGDLLAFGMTLSGTANG